MEAAAVVTITLLGRTHAVTPPPSLIEQEELYMAWREVSGGKAKGMRILRIGAALVGMSTRIGRESGLTYAGGDCDPLVYGGQVYDWLRAQGKGSVDGLVAAARAIEPVLAKSLLALVEAHESKADFSVPRGGA